MESYTDEALLAALRAGDRRAFSYLYGHYKHGLYHYCLRLTRDDFDAEDAVQQTFAAVFAKCRMVEHAALLRSWIYTVARNEAFGVMRGTERYRRRTEPLSQADEERELVSMDVSALDMIERDETRDSVRRAIGCLPPGYQEALLLREYDGLSYEEIALVTGQSLSAVKSKLFKARNALMRKMESVVDERSER